MKIPKSPFLVVDNYLSPLKCEDIIDNIGFSFPDEDAKGRPMMTMMVNKLLEIRLSEQFVEFLPTFEKYYDVLVNSVAPLEFEWYPEGCNVSKKRCENSTFMNNKWTRFNNRDFVGVLFLSDYQEKAPFDPDFEVRGGKLQFPNHGFSFNPSRGTLVIFPGGPNFVNCVDKIDVGNLFQIRIPIKTMQPYKYRLEEFPGTYKEWFK